MLIKDTLTNFYLLILTTFVKHVIFIILYKFQLFLFVEPVKIEGTQHDSEQRIDLIKFYNTIFVQVVQNNALKYSTNNGVSYVDL